MQRPEIEGLCREIVPGAGGIAVEPLGVGLLSETYRVARGGRPYVLKVAAASCPPIDPQPAWEARVLQCAGSAGLAPRTVYADPGRAVLLAQWVEGVTWTTRQAAEPGSGPRIAALLRRVHALAVPAQPRIQSPAGWIELYGTALAGGRLPGDDSALRAAAAARIRDYSRLPPVSGVLCHSDLHPLNVIDQAGNLILLDWEYAHVSDPAWDLAGWSANNDLDAEAQSSLLSAYLGAVPSANQWQRLRQLLWLYDYVCLLWSRLFLSLRRAGATAIAERARLLDSRLHLPAHYAA